MKSFFVILVLLFVSSVLAKETQRDLLNEADKLKTAKPEQSRSLLDKVDRKLLLADEEDKYNYLVAYNFYINGKNTAALDILESIVSKDQASLVKYQAQGTLLSIYATLKNWSKALKLASTLQINLTDKPILDAKISERIMLSLLNFYNNIGDYELAKNLAMELLNTAKSPRVRCMTSNELMKSFVETTPQKIQPNDLVKAKKECEQLNDPIIENILNAYIAEYFLVSENPKEAIELLEANITDVKSTGYQALIVGYYELMARSYLQLSNYVEAERLAKYIIDTREQHQYEQTITTAYQVLAEVAEYSESFEQAFHYYKQYSEAKQLNLDQDNAKLLAIQKAKFDAAEKNVQIALLDKENALLKTQARLDSKSAQNRLLALALLTLVLVVFILWTYKNRKTYIKMRYFAQTDELTGIANRHHFAQLALSAIELCQKTNQPVSFVIFDLDYFKKINDGYGHLVGDEALKMAVNAAKSACRKNDIIGRLGGEEFGVLLAGCGNHLAAHIADKCRKAIQQIDTSTTGHQFTLTASFGVSDSSMCGYEFTTLFAGADRALYQSKDLGRNQVFNYQTNAFAFDI